MISGGLAQPELRDQEAGSRRVKSWPAMLRRWLIECPQCGQVWLAVGARENDRHVCKDCGHAFVVSRAGTRGERPPAAASGNA